MVTSMWRAAGAAVERIGAGAALTSGKESPRALGSSGVILLLDRVSAGYGPLKVLEQVDLAISPGQLVFVVGPSGSGKSTLLRLATGELRPLAGDIRLFDRSLDRVRPRGLQSLRRRIGVVYQEASLLPRLTAVQNVAVALKISRPELPGAVVGRRALEALDRVGLHDRRDRLPQTLSGGEQRRVALARALVREPELLVCDEPTSGLHQEAAYEIMDTLARIAAEGGTGLLVATHEADLARDRSASHAVGVVMRLENGRLEVDRFGARSFSQREPRRARATRAAGGRTA